MIVMILPVYFPEEDQDLSVPAKTLPQWLKGDRVTLPEEAACPLPVLLLRYAQLRP
jgi:hypothetical protein